jgi:RecA-family ATPase
MEQEQDKQEEKRPRAILKSFSEIKSKPHDWLWLNRIPLGKLTIFAGDPSLGKSLATLDIIARVSNNGSKFPDDTPCPQGASVILSSEDDSVDTIKPRLDALSADMNNIYMLLGDADPKNKSVKRCSLTNQPLFLNVIKQIKDQGQVLRLLVIDPLDSYLDGSDSNCNEDVRDTLDGICKLAEREQFAIIGIKHLNKSNARADYRIGGSIAWPAVSRATWMFLKDEETDRTFFLLLKNNNAKDRSGFEYSIRSKTIYCDNHEMSDVAVIEWERMVHEDARAFLRKQNILNKYNRTEQEEVLALLQKSEIPKSTGEIASLLNKNVPAVSKLLGKLKEKELVTNPKHGQWMVKSNPSGNENK